ncbi:MAG: hypothetical protein HOV94_39150 [Saccharothrix sp.]|nr:hypothetical protein [Saccharothrix sp.]
MTTGTWTARQVAAAAGIAETSGRDLVRTLGLAVVGRDLDTGAKLYDVHQAQAALAARPGRGSRTDLVRRNRPLTDVERDRASWRRAHAREVRGRLADEPDERVRAVLRLVLDQLDRLVEAARRFPLYAMHPDLGDPRRRLYDLVAELCRQAVPLARSAVRHGHERPALWEELDALTARLVELTDLVAVGKPIPPPVAPAST